MERVVAVVAVAVALLVSAVPAVPAFSSSLDGAVHPRGVLAVRQEHPDHHHLPAAHTTTLQAARLSLALGHQVAAAAAVAAAAVAHLASTKQLT